MPLSTKAVLSEADISNLRGTLTQREEWRNLLLFELCLYTAWKATEILDLQVFHMIDSNGGVRKEIICPFESSSVQLVK